MACVIAYGHHDIIAAKGTTVYFTLQKSLQNSPENQGRPTNESRTYQYIISTFAWHASCLIFTYMLYLRDAFFDFSLYQGKAGRGSKGRKLHPFFPFHKHRKVKNINEYGEE